MLLNAWFAKVTLFGVVLLTLATVTIVGGCAQRVAPWQRPPPRPDHKDARGTVRTVELHAPDGTRIEGWLYMPRDVTPAPVVLMAPGFAGTKEGSLEVFAAAFAEAGIAVLSIDFRTFGGSGGLPRHWVDLGRHADDYRTALAWLRARPELIDTDRIALWGTSFSGGAVLTVAADPGVGVAAVIAQAPYLRPRPEQRPSRRNMAYYVPKVLADLTRARLGLAPVYVTAFGQPDERAVVRSRDNPSVDGSAEHPFWQALAAEPRGGWKNQVVARSLETLDDYAPLETVESISAPILYVAAADDDLVFVEDVEQAFVRSRHPSGRLRVLRGGHFDLYVSQLEANLALQLEFLQQTLGASTR